MSSQKNKTLKTNVIVRFGFWKAKTYLQTYITSIEKGFVNIFPLPKTPLKSDAGSN